MVDVVNKMCEGQGGMCTSQLNLRFKDVARRCANCFKHEFPDHPLSRTSRIKHKELRVRHFLDARFPDLTWEHDKQLTTPHCDCSIRRRVDHRVCVGNVMVAVETDEYQHRGYEAEDEEARYHDTFMGFSGRWVWIRFNPDGPGPPMDARLHALADEVEGAVADAGAGRWRGGDLPVHVVRLFYTNKRSRRSTSDDESWHTSDEDNE